MSGTVIIGGVGLFLAVCLAIGLYMARRVNGDSENYIVAGRGLVLPIVAATLMAQSLDANATLGNTDLASSFGFWAGAALPAADGGDFEATFATAIETGATPGHYPVVFGVSAQGRGLSRLEACLAHAYSFVTGLLGAAQRLGRFGHTEIQSVLESLEPTVTAVCERHVDDDAAAMASFAPLAEIMGMNHEHAGRRLFMS